MRISRDIDQQVTEQSIHHLGGQALAGKLLKATSNSYKASVRASSTRGD